MDIVVTIPKSEAQNTAKEDRFVARCIETGAAAAQYWAIGRKPRAINVGDRVYFVENGIVTCYHEFIGFVTDPVCEVTGRVWHGLNLVLKCPSVPVKSYITCRGFQGFHYTDKRWE